MCIRDRSKIISTAIYSHHGLADCINMESGRSLEEERNEKKIDYDTITERFFQYTDIDVIQEHIDRAKADSLKIMDSIAEMINRDKQMCIRDRLWCRNLFSFHSVLLPETCHFPYLYSLLNRDVSRSLC